MFKSREDYENQNKIITFYPYIDEIVEILGGNAPLPDREKVIEYIKNISDREEWDFCFVKNENTIVGFYIISNGETFADYCIEDFYVLPECRREGNGRAMFEEIIDKYGPNGCLHFFENDKAAQKFWEKLFNEKGIMPREWLYDSSFQKLSTFPEVENLRISAFSENNEVKVYSFI